jgi:uncharacterized membrane protein
MNWQIPNMETVVWTILGGGMMVATILLVAGLCWQWIVSGSVGGGEPISSMSIGRYILAIAAGIVEGGLQPSHLLNTGIAVLLLTPFAATLASMLFFAFRDHNYRFTVIAGFVLVVLGWVLFIR